MLGLERPTLREPLHVALSILGVGIVFFSEVLGIEKLVGGAVILLGVYLARRR
jgi:drug/metabolite transporter (DMT)-like permease